MRDWVKGLADQVKKQDAQQATNDAKFLETQRLKKEFGPTLWRDLATEVRDGCAELNQEIGSEVAVVRDTPESELSISNRNIPQRRLTAHFDSDKALLTWEVTPLKNGGSARGNYEVTIDGNGKAHLHHLGPHGEKSFEEPSSPSEIAEHVLGVLFRI